MLNEELKDQFLQVKLTYLNGYLDALAFINSYSIIGMRHKLYAFHAPSGDSLAAIQHNAYELFNACPGEWEIQLTPVLTWQEKLEAEFLANFERRIPHEGDETRRLYNYDKTELVRDIYSSYRLAFKHFIYVLQNDLLSPETPVYTVEIIKKKGFYRIIGIDMVFEIEPAKILFLQILGAD